MKYYQSSFKDYLHACDNIDIHPYVDPNITILNHHILYGPPGIGKYTQSLKLIKQYSPSNLKYEKRITCFSDKGEHIYRMSDIHFEIDMSLLGCNAKQLWNDIFIQIVEIVAVKPNKIAYIICKNFHDTHSELLELFYNYIQQARNNIYNIRLYFLLICETISCLPYNILKSCHQISFKRQHTKEYSKLYINASNNDLSKRKFDKQYVKNIHNILENHPNLEITNLKELYTLDLSTNNQDIFNVICDTIISFITLANKELDYLQFRDMLYDILIYNINLSECLYYVLQFFITNNYLKHSNCQKLISELADELKMFNNNYRPIYHLERIFYKLLINVHEIQ